jgi:BCD family chlorophyll transporter-like MFS transporter
MQDILLEPYGGQVLGLSVSQTTLLTAIWAFGSLAAYGASARFLARGGDPNRLAGAGVVLGVLAFSSVIASGAMDLGWLFRVGAGLIGFGGGLFAVGTLTAAMALAEGGHSGFALGAWGAVQATATGVATLAGGSLRDLFGGIAGDWAFGAAASGPAGGYTLVYTLEVLLLLGTLPAIIPLALKPLSARGTRARIGLDQMP